MTRTVFCWSAGVVVFAFLGEAMPAQDGLSEFRLHPDCRMELVAKEPQVVDPIAIRFDERGRMWVVEMRDYPTLQGNRPNSKIKILEDRDHDGVFESATLFADHLLFPTGIQPWKDGVIVTLSGKILFLADRDGDGVCDEERTLFQGFAEQNTQLRANHPTLGPDGFVYVANGLRNGSITGGSLTKPLSISGLDFRFDPINLNCESVTGYGQFGLTFDDAGHRFTCTNRNPLKRVVFENEYLKLAAGIPIGQAIADVALAGPDSRLFPISQTWTTSNLHANQFTAACGVHIYSGNSLSESFRGNAFTCDPTANVVHREVISYRSDPIVGKALPGRKKVEFLASENASFRPVNLTTGPDGALYVVDMRREVIEHPDFMPSELKKRPDLRNGATQGRIYRVTDQSESGRNKPRLDLFQIDVLRQLLSQNSWNRETAHRLILQSPDFSNFAGLRKILSTESAPANSVLRALALLNSKGQLKELDFEFPVRHPSPWVRRFAVNQMESVGVQRVKEFLTDPHPAVRFQSILSCLRLGISIEPAALESIARRDGANRWMRSAIVLASQQHPKALLQKILDMKSPRSATSINQLALELADLTLAKRSVSENLELLLSCFATSDFDQSLAKQVAERLLRGLFRKGKIKSVRESVLRNRVAGQIIQQLSGRIQSGDSSPTELNVVALLLPENQDLRRIALDSGDPRQMDAIAAIHFLDEDEPWLELAKGFRGSSRRLRNEILVAALQRPKVAKYLMSQIQTKAIKPAEIELATRKRFLSHANPEIRKVATQTLQIPVPADRDAAMSKFKKALELPTNAIAGRKVFETTCASCHQLGTLGRRVGPDISDTRTKTKSQLLLDIIRPNAAIDSNYLEFQIATNDGRSFSGIIVDENSASVTLRQVSDTSTSGKKNDSTISLSRDNIERMASTGKSLMPVGLEQDLSVQQMADLISFLKNWRYLEQNIPFEEKENAK